jgi:hypothetical protein
MTILLIPTFRAHNAIAMYRFMSRSIIWIAASSLLLALRPVYADFGTGTITFDESSYTLYDWSDTSTTSTVNVADDQAIGVDKAFGVDTTGNGTDDVFVRIGFSRTSDNDIDATDISAVFEDTSRNGVGYNAETNSETARAYISGDVSWANPGVVVADAVESGFETQAGAYFIRSAENGDTGYSRGTATDDDWTQFIIEYSGTAVTSATGEIWDIDYSGVHERFDVKAYSDSAATTQIGSTQRSPLGVDPTDADSYDAKPWAWSFDGIGNIAKIVFTRTATTDAAGNNLDSNNTQFPLAFNNFNPVSAIGYVTPEPSSLLAFGGIFSLAMLHRRRRSETV